MNRTTYGWILGFVGAGLATWWWRGLMAEERYVAPFSERGTVIFANTPQPSGADLNL